MTAILKNFELQIQSQTTPVEFAEMISKIYLDNRGSPERVKLGQFLTPTDLAFDLMDSLNIDLTRESVTVADLGAGSGVLSSHFIEKITGAAKVKYIHLDLIEIDEKVIPYLRLVAEYIVTWASLKDVSVTYEIIPIDIIQNSPVNNLFHSLNIEHYDFVLSNPPYFKIRKGIRISSYYRSIINGQANAYSLFMYLAIDLIKPGGVCGFITPQSFFNGSSFSKLREHLFENGSLMSLKVSRDRFAEFLEERVLQKICISSFIKEDVKMDVTFCYLDSDNHSEKIPHSRLVKDNIIYIPIQGIENEVLSRILSYKYRLSDFGLDISTGGVVPHETPDHLSDVPTTIPLIWLKHVKEGYVGWPVANFRRSQYLSERASKGKIILNGNYILLRRCAFSETLHHLYCSVFTGIESFSCFALENHVNYIYFKDTSKSDDEQKFVLNLVYEYLVSDEASAFFKSRCGNTQINVNDVRALPFPSLVCTDTRY